MCSGWRIPGTPSAALVRGVLEDGVSPWFMPTAVASEMMIGVLLGMGAKFELWSEQAHLAKIRQSIGEEQLTAEMHNLKL